MSSTETFQHYQVLKNPDGSLSELGRGAMGVTYKAFDTSLRCHVALKVINAAYLDSAMAGQRFLREARAAAGLSHPNVASVFHLGEEGGNYFYAMEYINGETVESLVKRRGSLPPLVALKITLQVARALRAAARLGLVHRDIKPANLMLIREDEEDTGDEDLIVKVIDFGLAKVTRKDGAEASMSLTVSGFVGTPHFASPEQLEEKDLDARSDIYSLGVTLWYMLSGRPPFAGSMGQVMSQHLTRKPPFDQLAGLPAPVLKVLERMLEKDPAMRQQTPTDLRRELEQAIFGLGVGSRHAGDTSAAAGVPASLENADQTGFPTEISTDAGDSAGNHPETARVPEPGVVLDGRYRLVSQVSQSEHGVLFQATEIDTGRVVALKILSPELLPDAEAFKKAQQEFTRVQGIPHPGLLQLFTLARSGAHTYLTCEWVNGFSLLDVLRHRTVLPFEEVGKLLVPLATAADALRVAGIDAPGIDAGRVLFPLGAADGNRTTLLGSAFAAWPMFQPKFFPWRIRHEAGSSATWAGLQTMVPARAVIPSATAQIARLAYELLGGNPASFDSSGRYTPLPGLTEAGNVVLRDALLNAGSVAEPSATRFVNALLEAVHPGASGLETAARPKLDKAPGPALPPTPPARRDAGASVTGAGAGSRTPPVLPQQMPAPTPLPARAATGLSTAALFAVGAAGLLLLIVVGGLAYLGLNRLQPKPDPAKAEKMVPPRPTAADYQTPAPPPSIPLVQATPRATAPPMAPTPGPAETPVTVSRANRLAQALQEARRLQDSQQTAEAFAAYVRIAEEFPESDPGLARLDSYVSDLRAAPLAPDLERRRAQQLRPTMERAARLGSELAMLFLGDHLLAAEPGVAADWIRRAADKGQPEAMFTMGDLTFRGIGMPPDPSQTAHWYELASDKGFVKAKVNLGECYELGKGGVQRDFDHAFQLLNEALGLEPGNAIALEKLAFAYEFGHGTPVNVKQAFNLMKRAAALGNTNAMANLGAYYIKGVGTPVNAAAAVVLFKTGAEKNNAASMFFYAQCLDAGIGGAPLNKAEAVSYFRGAAERGFPPAKQYCQKAGIRFVPNN